MKVNFIDLKRQYELLKPDIDKQIQDVVSSCAFIMGPQIRELESQLAEYTGSKHAISCGSGTDALILALMAYDLKPGDEIITTTFSFIATAEVIALMGAKPVLIDIKPDTFNINPELIAKAITPKTRGIIAVDLFGQCADYDTIAAVAKQNNLFFIADCAQSFGAQYKGRMACSLGDISCTSFFPAKPLGCFGDGGMVFTDDDALADIMRSLRVHGKGTNKYDNIRIGMNARMDTLQAAIVLGKFPHYQKEIDLRQKVSNYYTENLSEYVQTPSILEHNLSVFAQYCIRCKDRDGLKANLSEKGIPTAIHYPKPLHLQPAFAYLEYQTGECPIAEDLCGHIMALPMHPYLEEDEQDFIVTAIQNFCK